MSLRGRQPEAIPNSMRRLLRRGALGATPRNDRLVNTPQTIDLQLLYSCLIFLSRFVTCHKVTAFFFQISWSCFHKPTSGVRFFVCQQYIFGKAFLIRLNDLARKWSREGPNPFGAFHCRQRFALSHLFP